MAVTTGNRGSARNRMTVDLTSTDTSADTTTTIAHGIDMAGANATAVAARLRVLLTPMATFGTCAGWYISGLDGTNLTLGKTAILLGASATAGVRCYIEKVYCD